MSTESFVLGKFFQFHLSIEIMYFVYMYMLYSDIWVIVFLLTSSNISHEPLCFRTMLDISV